MTRILTSASLATALAFAGPALASDLTAMTDAERDSFRAEVRTYLMENPEIIIEAVNELERKQAAAQEGADGAMIAANADAIYNDGVSVVSGNPEGDLTMVEFLDYRCGYCRKSHDEVHELISSDGNIRFITKEFPILGPDSVESSKFVIAVGRVAGDAAYTEASNTMIKFNGTVDEAAVRRLSETLEVDADAVLAEMESDAVAQQIADTRALAQKLEINGTPTFVLPEAMLRGYVPLEAMRQLVEAARADS